VLSIAALDKLRFVHETIVATATTDAATLAPIPAG